MLVIGFLTFRSLIARACRLSCPMTFRHPQRPPADQTYTVDSADYRGSAEGCGPRPIPGGVINGYRQPVQDERICEPDTSFSRIHTDTACDR